MNSDDIIRMAREAGLPRWYEDNALVNDSLVVKFAALVAAAEREKVAKWMIQRSYATGHGDTIEDLLAELDWQIAENWNRAMINGVETEREACAAICTAIAAVAEDNGFACGDEQEEFYSARHLTADDCAEAIRARGQG